MKLIIQSILSMAILPIALDYAKTLIEIVDLYQKYHPEPASEIQEEAEDKDLEFVKGDLLQIFRSMQVGAERIREIVLSLRIFARQEGIEMKPVNLHEGIDSTLMILQNWLKFKHDRPAIEVIRDYAPDLPNVECYAGEMNQVFMNILCD